MKRRERGFSMIELLIVLAIIAVLVAIAVPILLRGRMSGNERATMASMRAVVSAEALFSDESVGGLYGTLHELRPNFFDGGYINFPAVQPAPGGGTITYANLLKAGFQWGVVHQENGSGYGVTTSPIGPGRTGRWSYFVNQTGVIRAAPRDGTPGQTDATVASPPVN